MPQTVKPERQIECLKFIRGFLSAHNQSPTRSEVGRNMGITKVSAHLLINKLKRDGYLYTEGDHWRNIMLTPKGWTEEHWGEKHALHTT